MRLNRIWQWFRPTKPEPRARKNSLEDTPTSKLSDKGRPAYEYALATLSRDCIREIVLVPSPCQECRRKAEELERWRIELAAELTIMQTIKAAQRGETVTVSIPVIDSALIGEQHNEQ
jgi:hypothetical protein